MNVARVALPLPMGGIVTLFLTALVTVMNVGVPADFLGRSAFALPVAAVIADVFMPFVRGRH